MNQILTIFILTSLFGLTLANEWVLNIKHTIRNNTLRYIVFKQSKIIHFLKKIKNNAQIYYNKAIVSVSEGIEKYNNLSDEDKVIIDTIRDLIM
jgi:hypothetical protein